MDFSFNEVLFVSREDANRVLEEMNVLLDNRKVVTVAEFFELSDVATRHVDHTYGWRDLSGVVSFPSDGGFGLNLPQPELFK